MALILQVLFFLNSESELPEFYQDRFSVVVGYSSYAFRPCEDQEACVLVNQSKTLRHCEPSPVAMHVRDTGHNFPVDQAQILDQDESWFGRGVREACHIRIRGSSLNRDGGRYHLPAMYNSILSRQSPSARDSESHNSAPSC